MNELNTDNDADLHIRCQTCLRVTKKLYAMSPDIVKLYVKFVHRIDNTEQICKICQYMFKKFIKFINNCCHANEIINSGIKLETNSFSLHYPTLVSTAPDIYYLGPDKCDDDHQEQDDFDFTAYDDDDELPLVKLRSDSISDNNARSKKRRKKDQLISNIEDVEEEAVVKEEYQSSVTNDCENDITIKDKAEPAGFTTRMVRETNEYIVIKLTKDQVLDEMRDKSKTDVYTRAPYKCEKCVKGFNFEDVLAGHMAKHTMENGMYLCEICSQYCPSQVSLRGHMKSHTTRYKCKVCGHIRLSRQHLLEHHAITHTSEAHTYSCVSCLFTTNKRTVIQRHVKTHASKETHTCHHCGKMFKTVDSLRVHSARHDKSRRYQCTQCGKTFIYPSLLHKHVQVAHEREDCYCVECDVKFKSPETLRLHFKRAKKHRDSSSYKFVCNECPERFVSRSALAVHRSSNHGAAKQHWCNICGRAYSSREVLRAHVWRTHSQTSRPLPSCPLCHKTFSRKSIVTAHIRTHTGERPYTCECGAAFAQRATLRAHAASKHRQKQEHTTEDGKLLQNAPPEP